MSRIYFLTNSGTVMLFVNHYWFRCLASFNGSVRKVNWILSGEGVERDSGQEQIADGQNAQWLHDEFNPGKQSWSLSVELNSNDEQVNIDHDVTITYNDEESKPNPLPTQEQ